MTKSNLFFIFFIGVVSYFFFRFLLFQKPMTNEEIIKVVKLCEANGMSYERHVNYQKEVTKVICKERSYR